MRDARCGVRGKGVARCETETEGIRCVMRGARCEGKGLRGARPRPRKGDTRCVMRGAREMGYEERVRDRGREIRRAKIKSTAIRLLPTANRILPTAYCLLPTEYRPPPTEHSQRPPSPNKRQPRRGQTCQIVNTPFSPSPGGAKQQSPMKEGHGNELRGTRCEGRVLRGA